MFPVSEPKEQFVIKHLTFLIKSDALNMYVGIA